MREQTFAILERRMFRYSISSPTVEGMFGNYLRVRRLPGVLREWHGVDGGMKNHSRALLRGNSFGYSNSSKMGMILAA